ncbi:PilZ domain-containing protein, partial [Acidobacteria bacterium AH-259-G07]|nr:PilZ domain-containing protein [Acidobacteria bacterium AH-259-G07]
RASPWAHTGSIMEKSERRAVKRLDLQLTGTVTFNIEGRRLKKTVTTKDISEHGAYLLTDTCPSVGDRIILRLQQQGSELNQSEIALEAIGTVLRVDRLSEKTCGFAVKFEETLMRSPF